MLKPEKMHLRDMDMENVSLLYTDSRRMQIASDVRWPLKLRDEREAKNRKAYRLVEDVYRQLRQNYEGCNNYPEAGRFYHGEMEMRRKAVWWRQYLPSLTTLYWLSSGYGQRPLRAGLWVVLLVLVFGWLYSLIGLEHANTPGAISHSVGAGLLNTLEVLTFVRDRSYIPAEILGRWLAVIQTVVIPLQVALFALAVRRAFHR